MKNFQKKREVVDYAASKGQNLNVKEVVKRGEDFFLRIDGITGSTSRIGIGTYSATFEGPAADRAQALFQAFRDTNVTIC